MKNMRKLVPAFAMLMVAAIMMSTASFAWFSMNTAATAGGMQVQATTSGGLAIAFAIPASGSASQPGDDAFQSSATFDYASHWYNGAEKLSPTSTDLTGTKWYTASSEVTNNSAAKAGSYTEITTPNKHYFKTTIYAKSLDEAADTTGKNLFVDQITITGTSHNLEKSLRVAINVGDTWLFFAPCYDTLPTGGLKYVSAVTSGNATTTANAGIKVGQAELDGAQLLTEGTDGLKYSTATTVDVYVYFEGEDTYCRSELAYDLQALSVSVILTCED